MSMQVGSATSLSRGSDRSSSAGSQTVAFDSNMFVKLLVAEIQNQDPTKPMSSSELVQQLASFSQVQQGAETNSRLASMVEMLSLGQAAAIVGRKVTDADGRDLGTVDAVRFSGQGLVVRLADGTETRLGEGVTIRQ